MTARRAVLGATLALALGGLAAPTWAADSAGDGGRPDDGVIPGAYIVTLADGVSPWDVAAQHANEHAAVVDFVYDVALNGYAAHMSPRALERVLGDERVLSVVPDRVVSVDGKPDNPPGKKTSPSDGGGGSSQAVPTGISRIGVPGIGTGASVAVDVAVIDTGVDLDHPDLNVVSSGKNCTTESSTDDGNGHGTHVAGTIGALDNATGVVGVAPGARIWPVKVLTSSGSGSSSSVICGINWVAANAGTIEVANMSLGGSAAEGTCRDGGMHQAVCAAVANGVTFAVAAGNSAVDARGTAPASYDEVITVSALADFDGLPGGRARYTCRVDEDDTFASFSNYGSDVDLIAPGVCIQSTWKAGGYNTISGTSMASPHVAGAAARYKALNPAASPASVKAALQSTGSLDWDNRDDRDSIKEPLLLVTQ